MTAKHRSANRMSMMGSVEERHKNAFDAVSANELNLFRLYNMTLAAYHAVSGLHEMNKTTEIDDEDLECIKDLIWEASQVAKKVRDSLC